jgi:hypothetical protein
MTKKGFVLWALLLSVVQTAHPLRYSEIRLPEGISPFAFAHDLFGNFYIIDRTNATLYKLDSNGLILGEINSYESERFFDPVAISLFGLKISILDRGKNEIVFFDKNLSYLASIKIEPNLQPLTFFATPGRIIILDRSGKEIFFYQGKSWESNTIRINYDPTFSEIGAASNRKKFFLASKNFILKLDYSGKIEKRLALDGISPPLSVSSRFVCFLVNDSLAVSDEELEKINFIELDRAKLPIDIFAEQDVIYLLFRESIIAIEYEKGN